MRAWADTQVYNTSSAAEESTTCKCFGHRDTAATDSNALLNIYDAAAAWSFAAPTSPSGGILYLSISDVEFTPNTMGS
jgi:hypothetical protein